VWQRLSLLRPITSSGANVREARPSARPKRLCATDTLIINSLIEITYT
jgi:hypothetical protein